MPSAVDYLILLPPFQTTQPKWTSNPDSTAVRWPHLQGLAKHWASVRVLGWKHLLSKDTKKPNHQDSGSLTQSNNSFSLTTRRHSSKFTENASQASWHTNWIVLSIGSVKVDYFNLDLVLFPNKEQQVRYFRILPKCNVVRCRRRRIYTQVIIVQHNVESRISTASSVEEIISPSGFQSSSSFCVGS